jgi:hypothetical protein
MCHKIISHKLWIKCVDEKSVDLADELTRAHFFKFGKIQIWKSENNWKKYQSVVYDLLYLWVNFYYKIPCILSSTKITKFQIWKQRSRSRNMFQILFNLSFLLRLQYKVVYSKNWHARSVRSWLHPHIFFRFLKLPNIDLKKNQKRATGSLGTKLIF